METLDFDLDDQVVKNAIRCSICNSLADKMHGYYQCQQNPGHLGDLFVGIFSDLNRYET